MKAATPPHCHDWGWSREGEELGAAPALRPRMAQGPWPRASCSTSRFLGFFIYNMRTIKQLKPSQGVAVKIKAAIREPGAQ